jgi:hypothetical protein
MKPKSNPAGKGSAPRHNLKAYRSSPYWKANEARLKALKVMGKPVEGKKAPHGYEDIERLNILHLKKLKALGLD